MWMFHSRRLSNRINNIHEHALRTPDKCYNKSVKELLEFDNSVPIHQKNKYKYLQKKFIIQRMEEM